MRGTKHFISNSSHRQLTTSYYPLLLTSPISQGGADSEVHFMAPAAAAAPTDSSVSTTSPPSHESSPPSVTMSTVTAASEEGGSSTQQEQENPLAQYEKSPVLREQELQRKRARDRKSQQAMRDRTKWTIHSLSDQVAELSNKLDQRGSDLGLLQGRVACLEAENAQLRTQNAALQLSLMSRRDSNSNAAGNDSSPGASPQSLVHVPPPRWEVFPHNTPPSCIADQILQGFVDGVRNGGMPTPSSGITAAGDAVKTHRFPLRPNLGSLLDDQHRSDDDISNVVADVLRTYREIESMPKQVAVFYVMATLLKWMVMLDRQSWDLMPEWLHPVPAQLSTPHSAWIDRIPWPKAREYLIAHPEITLDDFAAPYSSGFNVNWPYEPSSVLLTTPSGRDGATEITINPVYEEHIRHIRHWTVGDAFRHRFPELSRLIDLDAGQALASSPRRSSMSQTMSQGSPVQG